MPYTCFKGDDNAPDLLMTNLNTGDTESVCGPHMVEWLLGMLIAVTQVEWTPVEDTATEQGTGEATDEDEHGDGPTVPAPAPSSPVTPPGEDVPLPVEDDDDQEVDDSARGFTDDTISRALADGVTTA